MTDIEDLWKYACSGDIEALKKYYDDGGSINNRYFKAGTSHSLMLLPYGMENQVGQVTL